jgi:hypothetical protein
MTVRYHTRQEVTFPDYLCQRKGIEEGTPVCQHVAGEPVDAAVGELLLATVTPMALEVALAVQAELEGRAAEADQLRRQHVERARHHAELARRRYLAVDPDNRLVAASLEADWNDALRAFTHTQEDYERQSARAQPLGDDDKAKIAALATDFPALWSDPRTPQRERKRMVRLLLDDVTLLRGNEIAVHVRFKGGQTTSLALPLPLPAPDARRTPAEVVAEIDRLLDHHTEGGVAAALNHAGIRSGTGQAFNPVIVHHVRIKYRLASRAERLRQRDLVSLEEAAAAIGVSTTTVKNWHHQDRIHGEPLNDKGSHHYQVPAIPPFKKTGRPPKTSQSLK